MEILCCLRRATPREGDIVAALIDGEVTLKRYQLKRGKPFLKAENPTYPDLIPAAELVIQGGNDRLDSPVALTGRDALPD